MSLKLRLLASEYHQLKDLEDPGKGTIRYTAGDEFEARDQAEYERLTYLSDLDRARNRKPAAVPADGPDPRDASQLKGKDLQAALESFSLDDSGSADDKRARVQEYLDANPDASLTPAA